MISLSFVSLNSSLFPHSSIFATSSSSESLKYKSACTPWTNSESSQSGSFKTPSCSCTSHIHSSKIATRSSEEPVDHLPALASVSQCPGYDVLAKRIQSTRTLKDLKTIHGKAFKCLRNPMVYVDNNLITGYMRFGKFVEARVVFDKMSKPNIVSWSAIINGYLNLDLDEEAFWLFKDFITSGVLANGRMYVCLLSMCSKRQDHVLGRQLHACIVKGNWRNLIVDSAVVCFYAKCGELSNAFSAFDDMRKRDVVAWTGIITACSQQGLGETAFKMFSQMLSCDLKPNEFTVSSVLKACGEEKALTFGKQLHAGIAKKVYKNDIFIGTSVVDMYAKCGEISDSRKVFDRMKSKNMVTWSSIIAGYAREGRGEEAISLFHIMKRQKTVDNDMTMVSILRACGSIRALRTGKEVHAQIFRKSLESNAYLGSTLVWFYCKCDKSHVASKVLDQIPNRDVISWTALISGHTQFGHEPEALEFLKDMMEEGVEPNEFTYSSALKACANLESLRHGKLIHSFAKKMPEFSNVYVGSALIHMYAKCGCLADAVQVFDSMRERNLVSWKSMIIGYERHGLSREALKLIYRMQEEGIKVDDYILSRVITSCGDIDQDMEASSGYSLQSC